MKKFVSGNVIRSPKGKLCVVVGQRANGSVDVLYFEYSNSSGVIPHEKRYKRESFEDKWGDKFYKQVQIASCIEEYEQIADTIDDFIIDGFRKMMGLGERSWR
jgi:hypothetical protein